MPPRTGIQDMPSLEYFSGPEQSKSSLWTLYNRSPYHARYGEREPTTRMDFGTAVHAAVLEPDTFHTRVSRGPDDRRGNKWKDAQAEAGERLLLPSHEYDRVQRIADILHRNDMVRRLTRGAMIERSAFWTDAETGVKMRCRPDLYNPGMKVIADLKTCADARQFKFQKDVAEYGYFLQEPVYTEGWQAAGGGAVDGFVFLVVEPEEPFAFGIYELEPSAVEEGYAAYRQALTTYAECAKREADVRAQYASSGYNDMDMLIRDCWPSYAGGVIDIPGYGYTLTKRGE